MTENIIQYILIAVVMIGVFYMKDEGEEDD